MASTLTVGMCELDITPPAPVKLCGQFSTRISEGVESPLCANVFAAESGGEQIVICACDLVHVTAELCAGVRGRIRSRASGVDPSKVILCATHTHTGPDFGRAPSSLHVAARYLPEGMTFAEPDIPPEVWRENRCGDYLADRLCEAVCTAWERRAPAAWSASFGRAVTGHCRRVVYDDGSARMYGNVDTVTFRELEGGSDSGVELLYLFDASGRPLGALVDVACPAQCVEGKRYVSSDFWGKARDRIERKLGPEFVVVGLCAPAGDQSPRDLVRRSPDRQRRTDPDMYDLEGAIELGRRIAEVVVGALEEAQGRRSAEAAIEHRAFMVDVPLRRVTMAEYEAAKRSFDEYVSAAGKTVFSSRDMAALHVWGGTMERFHLQEKKDFYTSEIHVARFGDVAIATNPFELFLDYGNQIRARSAAAQTFMIQLACDAGMYLPTAKAERGGHYGAYVSSGWTGREGGDLLVRKTLQAIHQMWS